MSTGKTQESLMMITDLPFAVLRLQYRLARLPLQLIEDRVMARLDSEAPARLFYERSLGTLDATVGNALGDRKLQKRGSALVAHSDALGRAAGLDATARATREQATEELNAQRTKAVEDQRAARATKEREVEEARNAAAETTRAAAEAAEKKIAAAKRHADQEAARRTASAEAAKRAEQSRIRATEQRAAAAAQGKQRDAQEKLDEAATKRARADRVEELADVEKQKRQTERANNNA
jgi:hypothetical protein